MAFACVVTDDYGNCKEYLTNLDTTEFNQTFLVIEHIGLLQKLVLILLLKK